MIEVKGITKYYGSFKALDGVSFHVDKGEVLGFLGPNGAGKSTTMKVLTTYISASEGTASIGGHDVHVFPQEVRKRIGYLPETPPLYGDMTIEDYLKFAGQARGLRGSELKDRLETVITDCGLRNKLKARIVELSKGYKQRTGLAQALIHNPDVLILDEPTSGLDPMQIVEIRKLINRLRENRCIIFSTHILQEATAVADRLVIINGGRKIADGTVDELTARAADVQNVRLLVKGADASLAEPLRNIENVQTVEMENGPTDYGRFALKVGGGVRGCRAACEAVSELVRNRGLKLTELAPERLTLEQVFLQLLRKGAVDTGPAADLPAQHRPKSEEKPSAKTEADKTEPEKKPAKTAEPEVSADLPEDPDATAAATRVTGKPTSSENYSEKSPSETAWEHNTTIAGDVPQSDAGEFDDAFETARPGDLEGGTDTVFSPKPPDKEGE
ncbi:MAG: ATP-binding cassette domain-containing protein [Planctomycetes bacterium]|nr:ATP-binding cassette domain-containing protein [Planctomycetota bacterium]